MADEEPGSGVRPGEEVAAKPPKSKAIAVLRSIPRYLWIALSFVIKYIASKVLECLGLLMTVQQHQFWNAVQLKRVIADFKSMIKYCDERAINIPPVPIALDSALRQADDAIHAEFVEICELNGISIEQPKKPKRQTTGNSRPKRFPSYLMRNVGIPSFRGHRRVGVDAGGTDDVDGGEETDGAASELEEKHASVVRVKPIGKAHTGRLTAKIEEDDEGYGGFCNALAFLVKGVWKSTIESSEVATVSIEDDVQPEFHVGKKSFNLDLDSTVPKSVFHGRLSESSSDHVDRPLLSRNSDNDLMFFGDPRRVHRKKHVTPLVKGVTEIDGEETDGEETDGLDFKKIRRGGLIGIEKLKNSKIWQCFHRKAKDGYRPAKNLFQTLNEFIPLRVSNFRYKEFGSSDYHKVKELQDRASRWPVFSYWLMAAHVLILIVTLSVYGIAPIGYGQFTERALVQLSDLSVQVVEKNVTPNVFIGSTQEALVLLGANYAPCMRRDKLLFEALEIDMNREASESGCCIQNDRSGCVQVPSQQRCPVAVKLARFVFNDTDIANRSMGQQYSNRAVCGTSPTTCVNPSPNQDPRWRLPNITQWPICIQSEASGNDPDHLTCNLTGRPCCVGIQALCLITTLEHCTFLGGRFHQTAFLCSQVDCLDDICGLIPFSTSGMPDQIYRLWISLFLHGGILHILVILVMTFYILRDLEKYLGWLATVILFLGAGIGGNIASVLFVPYNPQVGPSAGIFGAIAFFLVYITYHWNYFKFPIFEILKYIFLVIVPLFFIGLFPYIDNYARVFGFIFGIFFSFIFVHYIPPNDVLIKFRKYEFIAKNGPHKRYRGINWSQYVKVALIMIGLAGIVGLYLFCFIWFYGVQTTWTGFTYFNCIPFTDSLCLDYRQQVRSRDTFQ